jgi:hypothetical protein
MKKIICTTRLIAFCSFNFFAQSNVTKEEYAVYKLKIRLNNLSSREA